MSCSVDDRIPVCEWIKTGWRCDTHGLKFIGKSSWLIGNWLQMANCTLAYELDFDPEFLYEKGVHA